jgi:hypothetical protein
VLDHVLPDDWRESDEATAPEPLMQVPYV